MPSQDIGNYRSDARELPSAMPKVIFDSGWGKRASWLDFDYHTFYELAHNEGIPDQAINDLEILFHYAEPQTRPRRYLGRFSLAKQRIDIMSHALEYSGVIIRDGQTSDQELGSEANLDSCVRHEMGHWVHCHSANSTEGIMKQRKRILAGLGILSIAAAAAVSEISDTAWAMPSAIPAFIGSVAAWVKYDMHKHSEVFGNPLTYRHEIPAYEYEEKTASTSIVSFKEIDN